MKDNEKKDNFAKTLLYALILYGSGILTLAALFLPGLIR